MKRNTRSLIAGILAILAGILIIIGAFLGEKFPKPLWIITAALQFLNAGLILKRSRDFSKEQKTGDPLNHEAGDDSR